MATSSAWTLTSVTEELSDSTLLQAYTLCASHLPPQNFCVEGQDITRHHRSLPGLTHTELRNAGELIPPEVSLWSLEDG